jgi:hypothetical protein
MHAQDGYAELPGGSQVWFAGLDDKDRTEKILGMEFATLYFNECSQIPYTSVSTAITRLAQLARQQIEGRSSQPLKLRAFYDCNPPNKSHWTYRLFVEKQDPDTRENVRVPMDYASFQINPKDNLENLSPEYLETLEGLPARMRARFMEGRWADANPNALFPEEYIDKWRVLDGVVPDMVRLVVGVDPSGADDVDNADNDEIGIIVGGLGADGNAYLIEDLTIKAGPGTWGKVATDAYDRHAADKIVAETNFGGAMVEQTIKVAKAGVNFGKVTASRGKTQRAEPFSALYELGKVRHIGRFNKLEDELAGFSTVGYTGGRSPNRADAWIWVLAELFPRLTKVEKEKKDKSIHKYQHAAGGNAWMA